MILLALLACGAPAPKPVAPAAAPIEAPAAAPAAAPLALVGVLNEQIQRLELSRQGDALTGTLSTAEGGEVPVTGEVRGDEWALTAGELHIRGRWDGARLIGESGATPVVYGDGLDPVALAGPVGTWRRAPTEVKSVGDIPVVMPQVAVADPAVNARIAALLTPESLFGQSRDAIESDGWADEIDFQAPYKQKGLLSLEVTMDGSAAYPDVLVVRRVIDLKTGALVGPETWDPAHTAALVASLDASLQERVKTARAEAGSDGPSPEMFDGFSFKDSNLKDFSLGPSGVTFHFDFGFPHAMLAAEPDGNLLLTWAEAGAYLSADSPLRRAL